MKKLTALKAFGLIVVFAAVTGCSNQTFKNPLYNGPTKETKTTTTVKKTVVVKKVTLKPADAMPDMLSIIRDKAKAGAKGASKVISACGLEEKAYSELTQTYVQNLFSKDADKGIACWYEIKTYPSKLEKAYGNKSFYANKIKNFRENQVESFTILKGASNLGSAEIAKIEQKFAEQNAKIEKISTTQDEQGKKIDKISTTQDQQGKTLDDQTTSINGLKVKTDITNVKLDDVSNRLTRLEASLEEQTKSINGLQVKTEVTNSKIDELSLKLTSGFEKITDFFTK